MPLYPLYTVNTLTLTLSSALHCITVGLDLNLIISELLEERQLICRGLAHPIVFNQTKEHPELWGRTPGLVSSTSGAGDNVNSFSTFQKFGAVEVTPRNYYKLMQSKQNTLLFPGGVRDVFQTDPNYPLLWPDKPDFVRTAARFNATIVPLSEYCICCTEIEVAASLLACRDQAFCSLMHCGCLLLMRMLRCGGHVGKCPRPGESQRLGTNTFSGETHIRSGWFPGRAI